MAFAPPGLPDGLNNGIFVGFHGKWALAGIVNEENPLVFVDLRTTNYFQFIGNNEPNIGHLDGLMSTEDSLFVADLTTTGDTNTGGHNGVIYQIKSLISRLSYRWINEMLELTWPAGVLQRANDLSGPWQDVTEATSPYTLPINPNDAPAFFRTRN